MPINSRRKGARVERDMAKLLSITLGRNCRRTAQRTGKTGTADIEGLPGIHVECKGGPNPRIWAAIDQAERDSKETGDTPVIVVKRDRKPAIVIVRLQDLKGLSCEAQENG